MVVGFTSSLGLEGRSRALFWFFGESWESGFFVFGYTGNHPQAVFILLLFYYLKILIVILKLNYTYIIS